MEIKNTFLNISRLLIKQYEHFTSLLCSIFGVLTSILNVSLILIFFFFYHFSNRDLEKLRTGAQKTSQLTQNNDQSMEDLPEDHNTSQAIIQED